MSPRRRVRLDVSGVQTRLLAHYDRHARELAWRRETDPYRIWVSEVMLQQTRAAAVEPYYRRWLERFPTLETLADAEPDAVLRAWAGLGYYRRATNLHAAVREVRARYGGEVPAEPEALRRLPGVGDYTAGAVASIAFGVPVPAVDGNVRRVLSRLYDLADPRPARLCTLAAALVPARRPGDFNQALMELGATICLPRKPRCGECPLAADCLARARGVQEARPALGARMRAPELDAGTAVIVSRAGRLLLVRRPAGGLLAGLWGFPEGYAEDGEAPVAAAVRAAAALLAGPPEADGRLGDVAHAYSHRRVTYHAFRFRARTEVLAGGAADAEWVEPAALAERALPAAQRRIAALAGVSA